MKKVMMLTGAGQIGMAIARRMGYGMKIIIGDKKYGNAQAISKIMNDAGFDTEAIETDISSRESVLLEEVGKVIAEGGVGVTISSQSGHRMPALTPKEDELLAVTPCEELLSLEMLQPENIRDTLHAYQPAKRCSEKRVMAESVKWGAFITGADFLIDGGATASYFYGPLKP